MPAGLSRSSVSFCNWPWAVILDFAQKAVVYVGLLNVTSGDFKDCSGYAWSFERGSLLQATSSIHLPSSTGKQDTSFGPTTALSECFQDFTALVLEFFNFFCVSRIHLFLDNLFHLLLSQH